MVGEKGPKEGGQLRRSTEDPEVKDFSCKGCLRAFFLFSLSLTFFDSLSLYCNEWIVIHLPYSVDYFAFCCIMYGKPCSKTRRLGP